MQYDKYNLKSTLQPHHEPFNSYGGGLPTDFKRVSGIYFNLFPARFVREEARIIHP